MRSEAKRLSDKKYYASPKGRANRWRKGELDGRDNSLRLAARAAGMSVSFTGIDSVVLTPRSVFRGSVAEAQAFLKS